MRDGIEYEFTTVLDVDMSHQASASKDRTGMFTDKIFQVTEETGKTIAQWLATGSQPDPVQTTPATSLDVQIIEHPLADKFVPTLLSKLGKKNLSDTSNKEQERILAYLNKQQEEATA
jgi:hypothetical protein